MLSWVTRHLPFLRPIWGLPQMFDGLLYAHSAVFRPAIRMSLDAIEQTVLSWPGVTATVHRFGGLEYRWGRREIGHLHSNGLLDIPFSKTLCDQMIDAGKAQPHHIYPNSGWISFGSKATPALPMPLNSCTSTTSVGRR